MRPVAATLLALGLLAPRAADAAPQCMTVAEFNSYMDAQTAAASDVTLTFTVTGVDLGDYFNTKGWLAELADTRCTAGLAIASLKVYGTSDPLNTAHPPGTVKYEYGSACCPTPPCPIERWAEPNPGDVVFTGPAEVCSVLASVGPTRLAYDISCDGGAVHHGEGGNPDGLMVTRIGLLEEVSGGHPMTNATATGDQVCFELAGPPVGTIVVPALEDVTASPAYPASVFPDVNDLACGASDGWIYLKFDLTAMAGRASAASLHLHSAADPSAAGDGGELRAVADNSWSEATLTWNGRPQPAATALGRVDAVTPDRWYAVDVSAQVSSPRLYSFALVPAATDVNGAHFLSKEASTTLRPYLAVQVTVVDGDGDGVPDGPDCNDADGDVHPGASEACDGKDNDCDGLADEGCPGVPDAAGPAPGTDAAAGSGDAGPATADGAPGGGATDGLSGCGCRSAGRGERAAGALAALMLALASLAVASRPRTGRRASAGRRKCP